MIAFKNNFLNNLDYQIHQKRKLHENLIPRLQERLEECIKKFDKICFRQDYRSIIEELTAKMSKIKAEAKRSKKRC